MVRIFFIRKDSVHRVSQFTEWNTSIKPLPEGKLMPIPDFSPAESPMAQLIRTRRTVNEFLPEKPSEELILQAIELARWAPNHKLTEPWRFHLIGPETVNAVVEHNAQLVEREKGPAKAELKRAKWSTIPGWLFVTSQIASDPVRNEENYAAVCCAIQNLMLFLWEQGVGTKWVTGNMTRELEFSHFLGIDPQIEKMVGVIWYGFPAHQTEMKRRPVSEIIRHLP